MAKNVYSFMPKLSFLLIGKKLIYTRSNIINGALIYAIGDTLASFILDEFSVYRIFGMLILGATIYAFEIPNYYNWIERKTEHLLGAKKTWAKTGWATVYFNPLWVARHLLFIKLFAGQFEQINMNLLEIAWLSFLFNIPISIIGNYIIQNKISLDWRFFASSVFSAIMAIYYAFSELMFT
ncbi:MAG: hypothetical protein ACI8XB_000642 [Patiriisocius sp.]|jgi:hypothetical protein